MMDGSRRHRRRQARTRWTCRLEPLEDRTYLSIAIQFDYSQDAQGFFTDPARRAVLQQAADTIVSQFNNTLTAIVPSGGNTWTAIATNPATGQELDVPNLIVPANTLIIYAGGQALPGSTLGIGGSGGYNDSGSQSWVDTVQSRGQAGALSSPPSAFSPWGGSITFDTKANWYFGTTTAGLTSSQNDFLSVASHELCHVLGFGGSNWHNLVSAGVFRGPASVAEYNHGGNGPPVTGSHWAAGLTDDGQEVVMSPTLTMGQRKLLTRLDFAGLQDIGWLVSGDPDGTIASAQIVAIASGSTITFNAEAINGPTDVDLFKLTANTGDRLSVETFSVPGQSQVDTFLRLFDATGKEVANANTGTYDTLGFKIAASGTYYLGVSSSPNQSYSIRTSPSKLLAGSTGSYMVEFGLNQDITPPPTPPPPTPPPPTSAATDSASVAPSGGHGSTGRGRRSDQSDHGQGQSPGQSATGYRDHRQPERTA